MVKPCSAAGSPANATSTRRTPAVRRAFQNPSRDASVARTTTAAALSARAEPPSGSQPPAHAPASTRSRSSVSKKSDENQPMASRPSQVHTGCAAPRRPERCWKGIGNAMAETSNATASAGPASGHAASAPTRRRPMYRCKRVVRMVRERSGMAGRGGAAGPQKSVDAGIPRDIQPCGDGGAFADIYRCFRAVRWAPWSPVWVTRPPLKDHQVRLHSFSHRHGIGPLTD